mmetsp:Transcript_25600/g.54689  ORF Transcript_25600/g.54689 Transcript_25600/m.54689 type:complete len:225 (-) Transcript_25600:11-685(-)
MLVVIVAVEDVDIPPPTTATAATSTRTRLFLFLLLLLAAQFRPRERRRRNRRPRSSCIGSARGAAVLVSLSSSSLVFPLPPISPRRIVFVSWFAVVFVFAVVRWCRRRRSRIIPPAAIVPGIPCVCVCVCVCMCMYICVCCDFLFQNETNSLLESFYLVACCSKLKLFCIIMAVEWYQAHPVAHLCCVALFPPSNNSFERKKNQPADYVMCCLVLFPPSNNSIE